VDDPSVVHRELATSELEVDRAVLVDAGQARVEGLLGHVGGLVVLGEAAAEVGARDHPHAPVLAGRAVLERQPDRDDVVVVVEPARPEGAVLVPGRRAARERVLGDEVAGPQGDVGADERLDPVEHLVREQEVQQPVVAVVRGVELVGELVALVGEVLVEDLLEPRQALLGEQLPAGQQVAVLAEERDVGLGQGLGHRGSAFLVVGPSGTSSTVGLGRPRSRRLSSGRFDLSSAGDGAASRQRVRIGRWHG
jgi:hypothetical protein